MLKAVFNTVNINTEKRCFVVKIAIDLRLLFDYNMTMLEPKYTITNRLAINIREIGELIGQFKQLTLSKTVFFELENAAKAISSCSSTQIEGNPIPLTDVKRILKSRPSTIKDTQREVLNYNKAIEVLNKITKTKRQSKLSTSLICKIQGIVVDKLIPESSIGKFRNEPVFVNDPIRRETIYLPPDAKDVNKLMLELVDFVNTNQERIDPLILAGIFHKQSVIIHPFMDGNGRTTRLITKFLLARLGINTFPLFSFESYYNRDVTMYFQNVGVMGNYYDIVQDIDFTNWLEYFTDGILNELRRVRSQLPQYGDRLEPHHKKILKYIEANGSITAREYATLTDRAKATRIQDFKKLTSWELIKPMGRGKTTYYILNLKED